MRRTKPATVAEINAFKTPGRYSVGDSLILNVTPTGGRSWVARIRDANGRRRDIGLGPLADVPLARAREKAREMRNAGRDGQPVLSKTERRKASRVVPTFRDAAKLVHLERKAVWKNGKHGDQWLATLEAHAFPKLGDMTVDAIAVPHIIEVLSPIWQTTPETARRVHQRIGSVIDWAFAREYRATQVSAKAVTIGLGPQKEKTKHFAALAYADAPKVLEAVRDGTSFGRLALEFVILTACRSGEARGAKWSEVDLAKRVWTVPADRMKAAVEHVVPLSARAVAVLQQAAALRMDGTDLVFPGAGGCVMSDVGLTKVLRKAGVTSEQGTVHGLRSTFRDWVSEETSFPGDVAEAALAHTVKDKVEAAYRRGKLLAKRAEMMTAWANYCDGVSANVIRLEAVA